MEFIQSMLPKHNGTKLDNNGDKFGIFKICVDIKAATY